MSSHRAHADGDAPCANSEDNAARVCPRVEGQAPDGRWQAGLSVPPVGKPPRASHTFPVSSQREAAGKLCFAQRQELRHQQTGGHSDFSGREAIRGHGPVVLSSHDRVVDRIEHVPHGSAHQLPKPNGGFLLFSSSPGRSEKG